MELSSSYPVWSTVTAGALGLLLIPKFRKVAFEVGESVLAVILIICLLAIVLGMPFGALYISYQGTILLIKSLIQLVPQLAAQFETSKIESPSPSPSPL